MNENPKYFILTNGEVLTNVKKKNKTTFIAFNKHAIPREFNKTQVLHVLTLNAYDKLFKTTFLAIQKALYSDIQMLNIVTQLWNGIYKYSKDDDITIQYVQGYLLYQLEANKNNDYEILFKILVQRLYSIILKEDIPVDMNFVNF